MEDLTVTFFAKASLTKITILCIEQYETSKDW